MGFEPNLETERELWKRMKKKEKFDIKTIRELGERGDKNRAEYEVSNLKEARKRG